MRIIDKRIPTTVLFQDIKVGECFIDEEGHPNIKLDMDFYSVEEGYPNTVDLETGCPWSCEADTQVIKVKAGIIIGE